MIDEIKKQVEQSPLTKDEARKQFEYHTKKLGIKHAFDFDEAWEIGLEVRRRNKFRNQIRKFESRLGEQKNCLKGEDIEKHNPLKHTFADGLYIREVFNPANEILVTKIHKKQHAYFLLKGTMSILTEDGVKKISAPYYGITEPGTKRVIYTHTDCVFVTTHATNAKDVESVEEEVIAKDFSDPVITENDIKKLKELS